MNEVTEAIRESLKRLSNPDWMLAYSERPSFGEPHQLIADLRLLAGWAVKEIAERDGRFCPKCGRAAKSDHNSFWCDACEMLWPTEHMGAVVSLDDCNLAAQCIDYNASRIATYPFEDLKEQVAKMREAAERFRTPLIASTKGKT